MRAIVRTLTGAIGATRFLVSLICVAIVGFYALLETAAIVPPFLSICAQLHVAPLLCLVLLYVAVAALLITAWYLWVQRAETSVEDQRAWRPIYRQTDRVGLLGFDLLLITLLLASLVVVRRNLTHLYYPALLFLGACVLVPLLLGLLPAQRPRRLSVPQHGRTMLQLAANLADADHPVDEVAESLTLYNGLTSLVEEEAELPYGIIVEVPPRF
jgi:hypothetical protein